MAVDLVRLAREAALAVDRGQFPQAVALLSELEAAEPLNHAWPRRLGEVYQRLGQRAPAVEALDRAADLLLAAGDLVKAVAVSKEILAIDPHHARALSRLGGASPIRLVRGEPVVAPSTFGAPTDPLESVDLHQVVPGSAPVDDGGGDGDIYEIPLEEALEEALSESRDLVQQRGIPPAVTDPSAVTAREVMPRTPLFSSLSAESFLRLVHGAVLVDLKPGQPVFRQGDSGDALYVIAEGRVRVSAEGGATLSELGENEFFGEMALLTDEPRSATVVAATPLRLLRIDRALVHQILDQDGWVITVLMKFIRDRFLARLLETHPLFRALEPSERAAIDRRARFVEIDKGRNLIRQGEGPKNLSVLVAGRVEVVRKEAGAERTLAVLRPGDLCGEMSLLSRQPAIASARAATKCFAIEIPAGVFYQIVALHGEALDWVKALAEDRRVKMGSIAEGKETFEEITLDIV